MKTLTMIKLRRFILPKMNRLPLSLLNQEWLVSMILRMVTPGSEMLLIKSTLSSILKVEAFWQFRPKLLKLTKTTSQTNPSGERKWDKMSNHLANKTFPLQEGSQASLAVIHQTWKSCLYRPQIKFRCNWLISKEQRSQDPTCANTWFLKARWQDSTCIQAGTTYWWPQAKAESTSSVLTPGSSEVQSGSLSTQVGANATLQASTSLWRCQHLLA